MEASYILEKKECGLVRNSGCLPDVVSLSVQTVTRDCSVFIVCRKPSVNNVRVQFQRNKNRRNKYRKYGIGGKTKNCKKLLQRI